MLCAAEFCPSLAAPLNPWKKPLKILCYEGSRRSLLLAELVPKDAMIYFAYRSALNTLAAKARTFTSFDGFISMS